MSVSGGSGKSPTNQEGVEYGQVDVGTTATSLFGIGNKTDSIVVRSLPGNGDITYIGWDSDVDSGSGFPLEAGDSLSVEIDVSSQEVYAIANSGTQTLAILSME